MRQSFHIFSDLPEVLHTFPHHPCRRQYDIERISLVVNYDIPLDAESYVHRIGRT
ncbi:MAG: helicase-related protein, partial [Lachnoanaerobaculum gingivalis]